MNVVNTSYCNETSSVHDPGLFSWRGKHSNLGVED